MCGCMPHSNFKELKDCSKCNNTRKIFVSPGKSVDCPYCIDEQIALACADYSDIDKAIAAEWRIAEGEIKESD